MNDDLYKNPEPVPTASQLAVLPFLAGVNGYLREKGDVQDLRITVHRVMTREGKEYLQQVCAYLRHDDGDWRGRVGRTFAVDTGIIGAAYRSGKIWRTKHFESESALQLALKEDELDPSKIAKSWLAVPFLGPQKQVVLILFADCNEINFFADDTRVRRLVAMSDGFCRLLDWLQKEPFENLRNFPLQHGEPVQGGDGVYSVQEGLSSIRSPRFSALSSFNYEAAVS